jgi:hypothetical protein
VLTYRWNRDACVASAASGNLRPETGVITARARDGDGRPGLDTTYEVS